MNPTFLVAAILFLVESNVRALEIVCTTGMVGDLVRQIAGDRAHVTDLMKEGIDPHLYRPTRDDIARLQKADLIFYNGLGLEGRLGTTLGKLETPNRSVVAVAESLPNHLILREGNAPDPHIWMDPLLWSSCIPSVEKTLSARDPEGIMDFTRNALSLQQQLADLAMAIQQATQTIPVGKRTLITAHDAFQYYARANALEVLSILGLSTESEAGVADINHLVDEIILFRIPAIFVESTLSDKNVRAIVEGAASKGHALRIGGTLYSDSLGPVGSSADTTIGMLRENTRTIVQALGGDPTNLTSTP